MHRMLSLATKGTLELDEKLVDIVGMEPSFWVAVALAYLEFLEDREVSSLRWGRESTGRLILIAGL